MADQNKTMGTDIVFGEERTNANDFDMIDGAVQDANNLELAILHLQGSRLASGIVDGAAGGTVEFNHTDLYADEALAEGSVVNWHPDIGLQISDGDIISPAAALGSETPYPFGFPPSAPARCSWRPPVHHRFHRRCREATSRSL